MNQTNRELLRIMENFDLSCADVAKALGLSLQQVEGWIAPPESENYQQMSEVELRLLQYSLMTENTLNHLF
ncbi:MAG: hypothetical protein ABW096_18055 [Candidatus Thiodiazotropha sp.]